MNCGLKAGSVALNGLSFNTLSTGPENGDVVLLLHGFPQFGDVWSGLMATLAANGFHSVAFDQRGYCAEARPPHVENYDVVHLTSDVLALADILGAASFHLVGHDWGGFLAWKLAAEHPDRVRSVSVLSTAHIDSFCEAIANDPDQKARSQYIDFFKMPCNVAESYFLNNDAERLRGVYQGKVPDVQVSNNVRRLSETGALTSVLNWYRALDLNARVGKVKVPTLYIWGSQDMALGRTAATRTADYVDAAYQFEVLEGCSHWLLEEAPDRISGLILNHLKTNGAPLELGE
ncbi:alpha/beta fold hydrolase [Edaphobacter bradus]|uniref:alpha/beta fold hydrolase n=1 Tax=Edaphobacter bradus TaxID=2259016 RepID=UPI0021DF7D9E|nr:alpha/beta hydrolase [Edaphobacter bradus]